MIQTMYKSYGIGLAAPQIGKSINCCFDIDLILIKKDDLITNANPKVYINPKIIEHSGKTFTKKNALAFQASMKKLIATKKLL